MTTHVFIDGFNLYNGVAAILDCKWVNLRKYLVREYPDDDIERIVFATSMVDGPNVVNQRTYLDALKSVSVEPVYGKFESRECRCDVSGCNFHVRKYHRKTEKRTDALLASLMVKAAALKECEKIVIVSADSDFIPPVQIVRSLGVEAHVLLPVLPDEYWDARTIAKGSLGNRGAYAKELRQAATGRKNLNLTLFADSQFEKTLVNGKEQIEIPETWRIAPFNVYSRMLRDIEREAKRVDNQWKTARELEHMHGDEIKRRLGLLPK